MRIYNSQTRRKEELEPVMPGKVGIYTCGPTVYNYFHIGNARPFMIFDVLRRHLIRQGYQVTYVQNLTDIDDKMIARAQAEDTTVEELGERFIQAYFEDADALGIRRADVHPRATRHIGEIIGLIRKLEKKGFAYAVEGDVYFDTQAYPEYGRLSGQNLDDLEAGARVDSDGRKKHPMDFALWKAQKEGEPAWKSPWGMGRPGWHIECSAMSTKYLGETFDIHCGGQDLLFPHHENEMAQSQAASGKPLAKYWMHNGFMNIDNQKMSKSLGNFFTVRDILKEFEPEAVRMFLLSAHYRSPLNFSREMIAQAKASLERLYAARDNAQFLQRSAPERELDAREQAFLEEAAGFARDFDRALDDDLNTADALGALFEFVKALNIFLAGEVPPAKAAISQALSIMKGMTEVLGLIMRENDFVDEEVKALVEARQKARQDRDFALADQIRQEITRRGYILEDTPQGPKVRMG